MMIIKWYQDLLISFNIYKINNRVCQIKYFPKVINREKKENCPVF